MACQEGFDTSATKRTSFGASAYQHASTRIHHLTTCRASDLATPKTDPKRTEIHYLIQYIFIFFESVEDVSWQHQATN